MTLLRLLSRQCLQRHRPFSTSPVTWEAAAKQPSYLCGPAERPLTDLTIGQVVDRADREFGDRIGIVTYHQGIRKTFSEVRRDSEKLAAGLLNVGLKRGDRIGIWGPNSYEWYLTWLAASKAGLILVNINPAYRPAELKYCLNKVGVKAIVSAEAFKTQDYYKMLAEIMPELGTGRRSESVPSLEKIIMMSEKDLPDASRFNDVIEAGGKGDFEQLSILTKRVQMDDPCNIQFTSGTTGNPKGALMTHHNLVNNGRDFGYRIGYHKTEHAICCNPPFFHTFGLTIGLLSGLFHGAKLVCAAPSFVGEAAVRAMAEERCTSVMGTPTMYIDMLQFQRKEGLDLSSLQTGVMGGAPCPIELCRALTDELNIKEMAVAFGMTETSPTTFQAFPKDSIELRTQTIGYPADHTEIKIIDDDGQVIPRGTAGELCTRAYSTMLCYWDDEAKTKEAITPDRWFHTGDRAVMLDNGYCQIVGRIKDMLIRGGENIYPREIEEVLHTHPEIIEAQVFGVPDQRMGEEIAAWLRMAPGKEMAEGDVKSFLKGKVAHFKIPRYVRFVEEFPTTPTGKVQKFKMREHEVKERDLKV